MGAALVAPFLQWLAHIFGGLCLLRHQDCKDEGLNLIEGPWFGDGVFKCEFELRCVIIFDD